MTTLMNKNNLLAKCTQLLHSYTFHLALELFAKELEQTVNTQILEYIPHGNVPPT